MKSDGKSFGDKKKKRESFNGFLSLDFKILNLDFKILNLDLKIQFKKNELKNWEFDLKNGIKIIF